MNPDGYYQQYYRPAPGRRHDHQRRNTWAAQKPNMPLPQSSMPPDPCNPWAQEIMSMMGPPAPVMPVQPMQHGGYQAPPMAHLNPHMQSLSEISPQVRHTGPYVWLLMIPIGYRVDGTYGPLCPFPPFSPFPGGMCEEYCPYVDPTGGFSPRPDQNFG